MFKLIKHSCYKKNIAKLVESFNWTAFLKTDKLKFVEKAFRRDTLFPGIGALTVYFNINFKRGQIFEGALNQSGNLLQN